MGMGYAEKLKDPRWKTRRREVLRRDGGRCVNCTGAERLQVHHVRYFPGLEPWEYDDRWLATLCRPCHEAELRREDYERELIAALRDHWVFAEALRDLAGEIRKQFGTPPTSRAKQVMPALNWVLYRAEPIVDAVREREVAARERGWEPGGDVYCRACAMGVCVHRERWDGPKQ